MTVLQSSPRPSAALKQQCGYFDRAASPFVEVAPPAAALPGDVDAPGEAVSRRYHPLPVAGRGWIDMHAFANGLTVSRIDCRMSRPRAEQYQTFPDSLRLNVVLHGPEALCDRQGRQIEAQVGDILVRHGDPGPLDWRFPADSHQAAVALELPRAMVQALAQEGVDLSHLGTPGACTVLRPRAELRQQLRHAAARMLALPAGVSMLARLELESLGLDLLLRLVRARADLRGAVPTFTRGRAVAPRWQSAVDEAVDIVEAGWNRPITIAQLARQVGINECYLKELFRLRTGSGIASYQRGLRMRHARELIESGRCTVQQAALACGYARADKFAEAFRRAHGMLPSALQLPAPR